MKPKMYLPVYHDTRDQRILSWIEGNVATHQLNQSVKFPKGNGNIRSGLLMAVILITFGLLLVGWA